MLNTSVKKIIRVLGFNIAVLSIAAYSGACVAKQQKNFNVDRGIVNHERIAYWLIKRDPSLAAQSKQQMAQRVNDYIVNFEAKNHRPFPRISDQTVDSNTSQRNKKIRQVLKVNGKVETNVLVVLVDFPDLSNSNPGFSRNDTDMYYSNYPTSHYQSMMFSPRGFTGPNGETLQSANQYLIKESGDTFAFSGQVYGWYTAKNNAKFYGGTEGDNNDVNPKALVIEAVNAAVSAGADLTPFDQDNNGVVDHILIVHSSIGEEAGGGKLNSDAIWSHSSSVARTGPVTIAGSSVKIANYTIQPIDSAPGVVVHEFGHDLGLEDEYDTSNVVSAGAPVADWSIMAGGSWVGAIKGTQPSTFSPLARDFLQQKFGGNWINQQVIDSKTLTSAPLDLTLQPATNHQNGVNQIKIELPPSRLDFKTPYAGQHVFYSGDVSNTTAKLSISTTLPASTNLILSMYAQWDMELDYDYAQVLVNGVAQANTVTAGSSGNLPNITNYISGKSPLNVWQKLDFDLTSFSGKAVTIEIIYVTDPLVNEFGLVVDNIEILDSGTVIVSDGAESGRVATLEHFSVITDKIDGKPRNYYLQYRSLADLDAGLKLQNYDPGALLWYRNQNYASNNVAKYPGYGFIGVVDADQHLIGTRSTSVQLRDAAFGLTPQSSFFGDDYLDNTATFNDLNDYSSPNQLASGLVLPILGVSFDVTAQGDTMSLTLSKSPVVLTADFNISLNDKTARFTASVKPPATIISYLWDFGDSQTSTEVSPLHVYANNGKYNVTLTVTDDEGGVATQQKDIFIAPPLNVDVQVTTELLVGRFRIDLQQSAFPLTVLVDYGDGETKQDVYTAQGSTNYEHLYPRSSEYTATVTVTDVYEQVVTSSHKVTTNSGLTATFTQTASLLQANFTSTVTGGNGGNIYRWNFGDGTTSEVMNPSHTYTRSGTFAVTLTVEDNSKLQVSYELSVSVSAPTTTLPPSASASGSSGGALGGLMLGTFGLLALLRRSKWLNNQR